MTKIVSENIMSVQKNNKKLKEYGIHGIGTGKMTYQDGLDMFGDRLLNEYPKELDFMFLTGNVFLKNYKNKIIKAILNGCNIKLFIVRPVLDGKPNEYLLRYSNITETENYELAQEIFGITIPIMKEIEETVKKSKSKKCGTIEIRTYVDEFRLNQRYATFLKRDKREIRCWLNVQTTMKSALSLSLLLRGKVSNQDLNNETAEQSNLMLASYLSFEKLWNMYPNSCPKESEYSIFKKREHKTPLEQ